jgi:hypothetical protein
VTQPQNETPSQSSEASNQWGPSPAYVDLEGRLNEIFIHFVRMRAFLRMSELGWAEHGRGYDGRLCWTLTKSGLENEKNGTMKELLFADLRGKN